MREAHFIDVSGSIPDELVDHFMKRSAEFSMRSASVDRYWFDTQLYRQYKDFSGNRLGFGGTDPHCIIDAIENNWARWDEITIFTDGYIPDLTSELPNNCPPICLYVKDFESGGSYTKYINHQVY